MDLIIIDAAQVKGRADTEMWMRRADMSLLVVRQNKTLAKYINDSMMFLKDMTINCWGVYLMMCRAEAESFGLDMVMVMIWLRAMAMVTATDTDTERQIWKIRSLRKIWKLCASPSSP